MTIQDSKTAEGSDSLEAITQTIIDNNSDEILQLYREHVPKYLADLKESVELNDREQISYRSHKMCSAMKTIGYVAVAHILEEIERDEPGADQLTAMVKEVEARVDYSLEALKRKTN